MADTSDEPRLCRRAFLKSGVMLAAWPVLGSTTSSAVTQSPPPVGITDYPRGGLARVLGNGVELFVDGSVLHNTDGAVETRLHSPCAQNIAIAHDETWEGIGTYHTVFRDGGLYRMYYAVKGKDLICYAESDDGIHFRKPRLGLVMFAGGSANNIVWHGEHIGHNLAPFIDANPDCAREARYKALGGSDKSGLFALSSPDGLKWRKLLDEPVITDGYFDSQNVAFWDAQSGLYRAYYRDWHRESPPRRLRGIITDRVTRGIKTATSQDFVNWSEGQWLEFSGTGVENPRLSDLDLYTNAIHPYYRAPGLLIGFPVRYVERSFGASSEQLPNAAAYQQRMRRWERGNAQTDALLIAGRGGTRFHFWNEAFVRPDLPLGGWGYGNNYVACHLVETQRPGAVATAPEISLYATGGTDVAGTGLNWLRRYSLRVDGFVSMRAPGSGGRLTTVSMRFEGEYLMINYKTSASGLLRVEIREPSGRALPGFTLADCDEVYGDQLDRIVTWRGARNLSALIGKTCQLHFELRDAELFSFRLV